MQYSQQIIVKRWIPVLKEYERTKVKGFALQKMGNLSDAIKYYKMYLANDPDHTQSHFNIAYAYMTEERYREAIRFFQKTLTLKPGYREVHLHLANCNEKIGNDAQQARHMALYNSANKKTN